MFPFGLHAFTKINFGLYHFACTVHCLMPYTAQRYQCDQVACTIRRMLSLQQSWPLRNPFLTTFESLHATILSATRRFASTKLRLLHTTMPRAPRRANIHATSHNNASRWTILRLRTFRLHPAPILRTAQRYASTACRFSPCIPCSAHRRTSWTG